MITPSEVLLWSPADLVSCVVAHFLGSEHENLHATNDQMSNRFLGTPIWIQVLDGEDLAMSRIVHAMEFRTASLRPDFVAENRFMHADGVAISGFPFNLERDQVNVATARALFRKVLYAQEGHMPFPVTDHVVKTARH